LGKPLVFTDARWFERADGISQFQQRLPTHEYKVPISELYANGEQFYTMYWPDALGASDRRDATLRAEVTSFLLEVVQVLTGLASDARQAAYASVKNRAVVATHLRRERSQRQARQARARDGYRCRVCGMDFGQTYGTLGVGFAEVHHTTALASPAAPTHTRVEDLVTVCANCHRMLHRMPGTRRDVEKLRKLVNRRRHQGAQVED
jgi:predicted HNH restriction endonuclease